jgi:DNA topoisomerase-1
MCIASMGHLRQINGLKNIDTKNDYKVTYENVDSKESYIKDMKKVIHNFNKDRIYIATDDDREGEAIGWHICDMFGLNVGNTHRIIFHEITKDAIVRSISQPTLLNMAKVNSAISRQVLDLIVGYRISPLLWKHIYNDKNNALSAGRCQTPCLGLVYDNDKIDRSSLTPIHKVKGSFTSKNIEFTLDNHLEDNSVLDSFFEKSKNHLHKMSVGKKGQRKLSPPKPFNTSKLIQQCSNSIGIGSGHVMKLCQDLYQGGYITYMRTESKSYSSEFLSKAKDYISKNYGEQYYTQNSSGIENVMKSDPHEAVRVTSMETSTLDIQHKDNRIHSVYNIIWRNTIESCMGDYSYEYQDYFINSPMKTHRYIHTNEVPVFMGWKIITAKENGENGDNNTLFLISQSKKKSVPYSKIMNVLTTTRNKPYYNESSLINKLEENGIGRPSTFASLVTTLIDRNYVEKTNIDPIACKYIQYVLDDDVIVQSEETKELCGEKNKLKITNLGIICYDFLENLFTHLFSYNYTRELEEKLDRVHSGEIKEWHTICSECYNEISNIIKDNKNIQKHGFKIEENVFLVFEKYGPVLRYNSDNVSETIYKKVKKDITIDLNRLRENKYVISDLLDNNDDSLIGSYNGTPIYMKQGKFGYYLECGSQKESLRNYCENVGKLTQENAITILEGTAKNKNVVKQITPNLSLRKGKYGVYAFHQSPSMTKPVFYNIKKLKDGFSNYNNDMLIDWICETYKVDKNSI